MVLLVKTIRGNVIYHEAPDGGWAWIVLGAGFFIMAILFSTVRCLGIFYNDFMDHYAATNSQTSWIFAIATSMLGIAAPVGSKLIRTFDSRKVLFLSGFLCCVGLVISVFATHLWIVYVGIGLVWGCGLSWSYVCLFTQVNIYFSRWRGLANGVVACGSATGAAFVPLGIQKLAVLLGWRGAMFIMAGLGLNICAFGALIRPISVASEAELSKHEEMAGANKTTNVELQMVAVSQGQEKSDSSKQVDGPDKVETESPAKKIRGFVKDYWLLALYGLTQFSVGICLFIPVMYIVPFSKDIGCTEDEAALLISMTAFGDVVFRPLVGAVISCVPFLEKNILYCLSALCLVQFALCVIPILGGGFRALSVYTILYGCLYGSFIPCKTTAFPFLLGRENITKYIGSFFFASGVASLISPPIAGYLIDVFGSYRAAYWYAAAGFCSLSAQYFIVAVSNDKLGAILPEHRTLRLTDSNKKS